MLEIITTGLIYNQSTPLLIKNAKQLGRFAFRDA